MLKIKLARFGKRNQPHYRIVVNEARDKRDGSYVALLGHYAPAQEPKVLELDVKAYDEWISQGAQPTETVAGLYARYKSGNPFPAKKNKLSKKAKAKLAAEEEAKKEAAAEEKATKEADKTDTSETEKKAEASTDEKDEQSEATDTK